MMLERIPKEDKFAVIRSAASLEREQSLEKGLSHSMKERERRRMNGDSIVSSGPIRVVAEPDAHCLGTQDKVCKDSIVSRVQVGSNVLWWW